MDYGFAIASKDYGQGEGLTILPVSWHTGRGIRNNRGKRNSSSVLKACSANESRQLSEELRESGRESEREPEPEQIRQYNDPEHRHPFTAYEILTKFYHEDMGLVLGNYVKMEPEQIHRAGILQEAQSMRLLSYAYKMTRSRLGQNPGDTVVDFIVEGDLEGTIREGENKGKCVRDTADFRIRYILDLRPCKQACVGPIINPYSGDDEYLQQYPIVTNDYLLPILYASDYERVAHEMLRYYFPECEKALSDGGIEITAEQLAERMGLEIKDVHFTNSSVLGQLYYNFADAELVDANDRPYTAHMDPGTILLSIDNCKNDYSRNSTIAHECAHQYLDRWFFLLQMEAGNTAAAFTNRKKDAGRKPYARKTPIEWMELQCDKLPAYLLLESNATRAFVEKQMAEMKGADDTLTPSDMREIITAVSHHFHVSFSMAKYRLVELGYYDAEGICCFLGQTRIADHGCGGRWKEGITYTISPEDAVELQQHDFRFAALITNGSYQYADGHFCLNDKRFLGVDRYGRAYLNSYARSNMDKCCLSFTKFGRQRRAEFTPGCASRTKTEPVSDKYCLKYEFEGEPGTEQYVMENDFFAKDVWLWGDFFDHMSRDYKENLLDIMDRKGITQDTLANELNVDRKLVYSCLNAVNPSKPHLVGICVALKIPYYVSEKILANAGITFRSNKSDNLYRQFLLNSENLTVERCDDILREHHLPTLFQRAAS